MQLIEMTPPSQPEPASMNIVPNDRQFTNAFRDRVWNFGVHLPHQGKRETARRRRVAMRAYAVQQKAILG